MKSSMAQRIFNTIGKIGLGLVAAGGIVQSALFNGKLIFLCLMRSFKTKNDQHKNTCTPSCNNVVEAARTLVSPYEGHS